MSTNTPRAIELADSLLTEWNGNPAAGRELDAAAELRRLAAVEAERDALRAELERIKALEPVAWGLRRPDGLVIDVITPAEHARNKGWYTLPLFDLTQPKEST